MAPASSAPSSAPTTSRGDSENRAQASASRSSLLKPSPPPTSCAAVSLADRSAVASRSRMVRSSGWRHADSSSWRCACAVCPDEGGEDLAGLVPAEILQEFKGFVGEVEHVALVDEHVIGHRREHHGRDVGRGVTGCDSSGECPLCSVGRPRVDEPPVPTRKTIDLRSRRREARARNAQGVRECRSRRTRGREPVRAPGRLDRGTGRCWTWRRGR